MKRFHVRIARSAVACRPLPRIGSDYFSVCQFCLDAEISDAQLLGGYSCASIQANTLYGSVLLLEERNVDWSLTHA